MKNKSNTFGEAQAKVEKRFNDRSMTDEESEAFLKEIGTIVGDPGITFAKLSKDGKKPMSSITAERDPKIHKMRDDRERLLFTISPSDGGLVFATLEDAEYVSQIYDALSSSKTWGELRKSLPGGEYSRIMKTAFDEAGEDRPKDSDQFNSGVVPGYEDGDYPEWLQQEMSNVLPKEIMDKYAKYENSVFNGSYYYIDPRFLHEIRTALEEMGYVVEDGTHMSFF